MNRLDLTFDEEFIRKTHDEGIKEIEQRYGKRIKNLIWSMLFWILISIPFLYLSDFETGFLLVGFIFLALGMASVVMMVLLKQRKPREIQRLDADTDRFIQRHRTIDRIYYLYDEDQIQYFENDQLKYVEKWADLSKVYNEPELIYLEFNTPNSTIWIPRSMTNSEGFERFVDFVKGSIEQ